MEILNRRLPGDGSPLPWSRMLPPAVVAAWLSSRLFVDLILLVGGLARGMPPHDVFSAWDGGWFQRIALEGYDPSQLSGAALAEQTTFPFFPLLPALIAAGRLLGLPTVVTGVFIGHAALLIGLALTHALVRRLSGPAAASWACWLLAFTPGALTYSMVYSEGLLLVFASGAFLARRQGRWGLASLLAALAALTRPNGLVVALALTGEALLPGGERRRAPLLLLPTLAVLLLWCGILLALTGNPLIWVDAKKAWTEISVLNILSTTKFEYWAQFCAGLIALGLLALGWRSQPWGWRLFGLFWLLPSFFLGVVGFPRYVSACFPVFAALGAWVARRDGPAGPALLALSAAALAVQTTQVGLLRNWVP